MKYLIVVLAFLLAVGCAKNPNLATEFRTQESERALGTLNAEDSVPPTYAVQPRMLVRTASMSVHAKDPESTAALVEPLANKYNGYVEWSKSVAERNHTFKLRIPSDQLSDAMHEVETWGNVVSQNVSSDDITRQYVDLEARHKNLLSLRDRLRNLLDSARDVQEVLKVEAELSRVQGEADALDAQLRYMREQAAMSSLTINIDRKVVLGPVSLVGAGALWVIEKLFVIQH